MCPEGVLQKQLQWLRPLAAVWGNEAAGEALRAANKTGEAFRADRLAAFPAIFGKVTRREALVVWQADMLARSRHRPRPHDETFAASRYRETASRTVRSWRNQVKWQACQSVCATWRSA